MKGMFFRISKVALLLTVLVGLNSCLDEGPAADNSYERLQKEIAEIDAVLAFSPNVIKDPSGIRIVLNSLGEGLPALPENYVDVSYTGKLFTTGAIFDDGRTTEWDQEVPLKNLIYGWQVAFTTLPPGTSATLYIPSLYAYGNRKSDEIPANSILKFDVTFHGVEYTSTETNRLSSDKQAIDNYLTTNNVQNVVQDDTGLRYVITQAGAGSSPSMFGGVSLIYTLKLLTNPTGQIGKYTRVHTTEAPSRLVDYINGMKVGLSKMNKGSKATLYVPSGLAFGKSGATDSNGNPVIPADSNLIIEVEVTDVF